MTTDEPSALFLTGTVGSGKSTTLQHAGSILTRRGVPHALVDLDFVRLAWPAPPDDPFHQALELANLRAMTPNFLAAGARRLLLAGVLESVADRDRYAAAVDVPLQVCRLRVHPALLRDRLHRRHADEPDQLGWHLNRFATLQQIQDEAAVEDVMVEVGDPATPYEVAVRVLDAAGW